jgi:hypothetical protein
MREVRNIYKILVRKRQGKIQLYRPSHRKKKGKERKNVKNMPWGNRMCRLGMDLTGSEQEITAANGF